MGQGPRKNTRLDSRDSQPKWQQTPRLGDPGKAPGFVASKMVQRIGRLEGVGSQNIGSFHP